MLTTPCHSPFPIRTNTTPRRSLAAFARRAAPTDCVDAGRRDASAHTHTPAATNWAILFQSPRAQSLHARHVTTPTTTLTRRTLHLQTPLTLRLLPKPPLHHLTTPLSLRHLLHPPLYLSPHPRRPLPMTSLSHSTQTLRHMRPRYLLRYLTPRLTTTICVMRNPFSSSTSVLT